MDAPGSYDLASVAPITAPVATPVALTAITGLAGMSAVSLEAEFSGTGGTSVTAIVRTRNQGGTWREIKNFHFTAAGAKYVNIVADEAQAAADFAALANNAEIQGFLGTELQVVYFSAGTWVNGALAVRAAVR